MSDIEVPVKKEFELVIGKVGVIHAFNSLAYEHGAPGFCTILKQHLYTQEELADFTERWDAICRVDERGNGKFVPVACITDKDNSYLNALITDQWDNIYRCVPGDVIIVTKEDEIKRALREDNWQLSLYDISEDIAEDIAIGIYNLYSDNMDIRAELYQEKSTLLQRIRGVVTPKDEVKVTIPKTWNIEINFHAGAVVIDFMCEGRYSKLIDTTWKDVPLLKDALLFDTVQLIKDIQEYHKISTNNNGTPRLPSGFVYPKICKMGWTITDNAIHIEVTVDKALELTQTTKDV